jgi:hypothetical protein
MSKHIAAALIRIGKKAQRDSSASVGAMSVALGAGRSVGCAFLLMQSKLPRR